MVLAIIGIGFMRSKNLLNRLIQRFLPPLKKGFFSPFSNRSFELSTVKVHDLRPSFHKIINELLFSVGTSVYLRDSTQFRIGTKNQIRSGCGPLYGPGDAITSNKTFRHRVHSLPCCIEIQQIDKKVIS